MIGYVTSFLQDGLWFSLGCAASRAGQTELSIEAWHRTVALEPDVSLCQWVSVSVGVVVLCCVVC